MSGTTTQTQLVKYATTAVIVLVVMYVALNWNGFRAAVHLPEIVEE